MKKLIIAAAIVFILIIGAYLYVRLHVLKVKDFKPDNSRAKNILDLRPSIIAKFQQLVKDGSDGLYILSIDKIEPDVLASKLDMTDASIRIDSAAMKALDSSKKLPDDIFEFHFKSLHIEGIGINDLLHKDRIDIKGITITAPIIKVFHKDRPYNEADRIRDHNLSLYRRIKGSMKYIAIGNINIQKGTFIQYDVAKRNNQTKFNDVSIQMDDILMDSTTEFDPNRFLFAKHATIETGNYTLPTADSLYYFKIGSISVAGEQHKITATNVELQPRGNREQFAKKLSVMTEMYTLRVPKIILSNANWWNIMNREKFIADDVSLYGGSFSIFLDRRLPKDTVVTIDNFPQQSLMRIPFQVSVKKLHINDLDISYGEFSKDTHQNGTAYFDKINGEINNITNNPAEIKKHVVAGFSAKCLFMHHVPMTGKFTFDLSKYKTGTFTADLQVDTLDNITINPVSEPLGPFSVKSGQMQSIVVHVEGDNFNAKGNIAMHYSDLHITPLKEKKGEPGVLKTKKLTSLVANVALIKNNNPGNGELRQPDFSIERDHHGNFFNLVWTCTFIGILKTIGVPVKLVIK